MSYLTSLMALACIIATVVANPQFRFNNNGFFNRPAARPNQAPRGNGGNCSPTLNYQSGKLAMQQPGPSMTTSGWCSCSSFLALALRADIKVLYILII